MEGHRGLATFLDEAAVRYAGSSSLPTSRPTCASEWVSFHWLLRGQIRLGSENQAYAAGLGRPVLNGTRTKLERQAVELLAQGLPEAWLCDRARELAARGWSDLAQHAERSTAPLPSDLPAQSSRPGLPDWCGECGDGTGTAARLNPRFRKVGPAGNREECPRCHPNRQHASTA
ncbi:hypothetical protein [Streptomyces turgidiscabies]|uniref:Uncharacterized protein n=1 Tax=Streptomyces turgidiscabies TaxID=85558 RepID=A0ABU0RSU1_9ACTN|nr:hypothetical protein [Streptomyces turgidiscabies]MDQ0935065.1 hypothetical protein [Streptomyces turgidiscabies]